MSSTTLYPFVSERSKVVNIESEKLDPNYADLVLDIVYSENFDRYDVLVKDRNSTDGYMGEPTQLTLKGSTRDGKNKVVHLFCKAATKHEFIRRNFPVNDVFKREKFLYTVVLDEFRKFEIGKGVVSKFTDLVAKCFRANDSDLSEVIVLEDLSKKGFRMLRCTNGMDDNHLRISLKQIAKLHALSIAYSIQKPERFRILKMAATDIQKHMYEVSKFYDVLEEKCKRTAKMFYGDDDQKLYERFYKFACEEAKTWLINIPEDNGEMVILHGDCWSNNFLFHYEDENSEVPDEVAIIDWQHSRMGSPAIDLSYFLFTACSRDSFIKMNDYLKFYHENLCNHLTELGSNAEEIFPFYNLLQQWKKYLKYGLILSTVVIHSMVLSSEEEIESITHLINSNRILSDMFLFEKASKESNLRYKDRIRNVIRYCVDNNLI